MRAPLADGSGRRRSTISSASAIFWARTGSAPDLNPARFRIWFLRPLRRRQDDRCVHHRPQYEYAPVQAERHHGLHGGHPGRRRAVTLHAANGVLLYLDEIQYFNKQQQTLLEFIENGSITLIASTTENPYFYVYNAILSRSTVFGIQAGR